MPFHILVVHDDSQTATHLREVLTAQGYVATSVASADAALDHLAARPCDLVLLDGELPGISGRDACARIRERHGSFLPVLIVSAESDSDAARTSDDAGADDYVRPADRTAFTLKVRGYLRSKALHDDLLRTR